MSINLDERARASARGDGANPNGTWQLWVTDDASGDTGDIGGWALRITAEVDLATVDEQVAGHAIEVFVYDSQNSTPDVKRLLDAARKAAIPVMTVTETLTPAGATFQAWQSRQLRQLRDALARARAKAAS